MGGRNNDVTRPKQNRNRPLSAVIEEFEVDDSNLKCNIVNNVHNGDSTATKNNVNDNKPAENVVLSSNEVSKTRSEQRTPEPNSPTTPSAPGSCESGSGGGGSSEGSPKPPRRGSFRTGRRQALTPNLSPKLGRRGSFGLSRRFTSPQNDVIDSDDDTLLPSDMTRLRQTADRLHLSTRRASVMQWREQYVECPEFPVQWNSGNGDTTEQNGGEKGSWTTERTQRINTALDWIKNELMEMRAQDQQLARQLLTIRSDIHQLKLARSCEEHQDMLDDVQSELEELQEFADVLDLPTHTITDSPLQHLGVTRMNFSARRFSTC